VVCGFDEIVEVLLNANADPTARDQQGRTPVHFAASCGHISIVESLLQSGGSATTPDNSGYTPIHWAAYNGHEKCLESLVEVILIALINLFCLEKWQ
jgi:ankyrin repeat protein